MFNRGDVVRKLREQRGWSQPELAKRAGLNKSTIVRIEEDDPTVRLDTVQQVSTVFGKIEQPRFLSGQVAGKATKTNKIGYVAAFPIPEVLRGINSFTLGVRTVNPEATVHVVWTNTWFGPPEEKVAAEALLDQGADVIPKYPVEGVGRYPFDESPQVFAIGIENGSIPANGPFFGIGSEAFRFQYPYFLAVHFATFHSTMFARFYVSSSFGSSWVSGSS